jgi:hypothetical protein
VSLEAILTVVAIVLAVLALIPQERAQDLRIRLGGSATVIATIAAGLVLYWALLEPVHALPLIRRLPRFVRWLDGWDPASSSLVTLLLATGFAWWRYGRRIPVSRLPKLAAVFADGLARRRFTECTHLLEAHFEAIRDGLNGDYWQLRMRRRWFPTPAELHLKALTTMRRDVHPKPALDLDEESSPPVERLQALISMAAPKEPSRLSAWLVEWAGWPTDAAHDIVRSLSHSPEIAGHIAATNPYLGLSLSQLPSTWLTREFTETLAQALLSDPESAFYRELRRAENIDLNNIPVVDPVDQPFLNSLCSDALRKDGAQLLYTYLDAGIRALRGHGGEPLRRELNNPIGEYFDRTRWSSPPFATIYLVEIAAPRNAVSAEAQDLNLYVLLTLTNSLLDLLSPSDDVDLTREWPTPTHYLLYECVSVLVDLVVIWRDRPAGLPPNKLTDSHEGLPRILPTHAIKVLSDVMCEALRSPKLDGRFKGYLLEVWWRAYWEKYKEPWPHSDAVLSALSRAGHTDREGDLRKGLAEALDHVDLMLQISEGGDRVRAAFSLPPRTPASL